MTIPIIFGIPAHIWGGMLLLILIIFQIAVAKRFIPVPFRVHRIMGYVILILAIFHGSMGAGLYFGLFGY